MNDPISLARQTDANRKSRQLHCRYNPDEPTAGIVIGWLDSALQVGPETGRPDSGRARGKWRGGRGRSR